MQVGPGDLHRVFVPLCLVRIVAVAAFGITNGKRVVIVRQRLIVVFLIGNGQTHVDFIAHLNFGGIADTAVLRSGHQGDFWLHVGIGFIDATDQQLRGVRFLLFATVHHVRRVVITRHARQRRPVEIALHRPAKLIVNAVNDARQRAKGAHTGQYIAMAIRAAPVEQRPGFVVIVIDRAVFIADFPGQLRASKSITLRGDGIRHMAPHLGLGHIRAGDDSENNAGFADLRNTGQRDRQRRFYTQPAGLSHLHRRHAVGIGSAVVFRCGGG